MSYRSSDQCLRGLFLENVGDSGILVLALELELGYMASGLVRISCLLGFPCTLSLSGNCHLLTLCVSVQYRSVPTRGLGTCVCVCVCVCARARVCRGSILTYRLFVCLFVCRQLLFAVLLQLA